MASTQLNKYIWLVNTIYSAGKIRKEDLDRKWAHSMYNESHESVIPRRTFLRWRDGVEELFGLEIAYSRAQDCYYVVNKEVMDQDRSKQWLLQSFAVTNMIHESEDMQERILLEPTKTDALYLSTIIEAMRMGKQMQVTYQKFATDSEPYTFVAAPYCIKNFKQRWYVVLARPDKPEDGLRVFALDRIHMLELTQETYSIPKDFDGEVFFQHCYGIWHDIHIPAEHVEVEVGERTAMFLRSLPLHPTQKEQKRSDGRVRFSFLISPTYDFIQELRTYGPEMKVLAPQWLADRVRDDARRVAEMYEEGM